MTGWPTAAPGRGDPDRDPAARATTAKAIVAHTTMPIRAPVPAPSLVRSSTAPTPCTGPIAGLYPTVGTRRRSAPCAILVEDCAKGGGSNDHHSSGGLGRHAPFA